MRALSLCTSSSRLSLLLSSSRRVVLLVLQKRLCSCIRSPTTTQITHQWRPTTTQLLTRREVTTTTTTTTSNTRTTTSSSAMPSSPSTTTKTHYEDHSKQDSYEDAYFYEPGAYTEYLATLVKDRLSLHDNINAVDDDTTTNRRTNTSRTNTTKRIVLDIGGGTGNFTKMILKDTSSDVQGIVIDPFLVVDDNNDDDNIDNNKIRYVKQPAEKFIHIMQEESSPTDNDCDNNGDIYSLWKKGYHQVLLKEVVHHFNNKGDRIEIFRGIYDGLVPFSSSLNTSNSNHDTAESSTSPLNQTPSILIITRPKYDIDYPLWDEARAVWSQKQPSVDCFEKELTKVGFTNVKYSIESHPCTIQLERWQNMIRNRFWSTFSHFTNTELEIACKTLARNEKHRTDKNGNLHFEDRLVFITACKE